LLSCIRVEPDFWIEKLEDSAREEVLRRVMLELTVFDPMFLTVKLELSALLPERVPVW